MKALIADDHPIFREGLGMMLGKLFGDVDVVEAGDFAQVRDALLDDPAPDLLLLDLYFPGFDYASDLKPLRAQLPLSPIVVISMLNDGAIIDQLVQLGINGFISKAVRPEQISRALHDVMQGDSVVLRASLADGATLHPPSVDTLSRLSPRQVDVLKLLARGLSNKEIARTLELSPYTIRIHVSGIFKVLGVTSRAAAASIAVSNGFG